MRTKIVLVVVACFSMIQIVSGQTVEQIRQDKDTYLFSEGWGETLKAADDAALVGLISKISISVRNDFTSVEIEKTEGNEFISETSYNSIINTYSQSTLTNTERIIIKNEPNAHVFRYIRKSEINRIFEGRKNKILELISIAETADKNEQVGDALRYYYWAYVLLTSMRYPNEMDYENFDGDKKLLTAWLPFQIEHILNNISIEYKGENCYNKNNIELTFKYKDKPIRNLDYTYFDGVDWSSVYSATDGIGIVELRPHSPEIIQLKVEYEYYGESMIDSEVHEVLKNVKGKIFKRAYRLIDMGKETMLSENNPLAIKDSINVTFSKDSIDGSLVLQPIVAKVANAILSKQYQDVKDCFTQDGFQIFEKLIKYGKASLIDQSNLVYLNYGSESYCRNLMMNFAFEGNNRKFIENVTLTFDSQCKISNITFGLDQQAIADIMNKEAWGNMAKIQLINFLENYKTAYALKRIDYISNIFSDDALIITGRVVKRKLLEGENKIGEAKHVEFIRQNKQEYIKRLSQVFLRNDFVNIKFANTDLTKMGKSGELYGIQIRQDYFSTYYGDSGYLFLMVDLNNPEEPIIHVRTWQPERDPNFGIISAGHF